MAPYAALPGVLKSPLLPSSHTLVMDHNAEAVLGQMASAERLSASAADAVVLHCFEEDAVVDCPTAIYRLFLSWVGFLDPIPTRPYETDVEFFLHDSSDRRFYASEPLANFLNPRTDLEFLMFIRIGNTPLLYFRDTDNP